MAVCVCVCVLVLVIVLVLALVFAFVCVCMCVCLRVNVCVSESSVFARAKVCVHAYFQESLNLGRPIPDPEALTRLEVISRTLTAKPF